MNVRFKKAGTQSSELWLKFGDKSIELQQVVTACNGRLIG